MTSAIEVANISKTYREDIPGFFNTLKYLLNPSYKTALENVSFSVERGEIFGLLGPNGAGKTTLIKIILGLIAPTNGSIRMLGCEIPKERSNIIDKINIVFSRSGCYWNLTGRDHLEFYGKIYRVKDLDEKIKNLVDLFELNERIDMSTDKYSTGEVMRLNLARSLLNDPELIILDEPTIGLDPLIALKIRDFFLKLNEEKKTTILLTTHYMEEADKLCDRIAIVDEGKLVAMDTPENLKTKLNKEKVCEFGVSNLTGDLLKEIQKRFGRCSYYEDQSELRVIVDKFEDVSEIIDFLRKNKVKVSSVHTEKPTLEDVFLFITGKRLRGEEDEIS
jgi:ABC-2 type transport system ATP-binding protein